MTDAAKKITLGGMSSIGFDKGRNMVDSNKNGHTVISEGEMCRSNPSVGDLECWRNMRKY